MTDPTDRFAWHPEPELIGYGDAATSRAAMERLGADTWATALDFLYDQAAHRAMGDPAPYADAPRHVLRGDAAGRRRRPARPRPIADDPRRVPRPAGGRPDERAAPAPVRLLHAAAAAGLDDGRAARPDDQPGRRRLARRARSRRSSRRRSCAGCATSSATAPESFGLLTSGGVMANFMGMALARDIHLGRLLGRGAGAARGAARRRPRLHLGPDPFLDRPGARPARLPARDAGGRPVGRAVPAARRAGRGGRRAATGPPA